MAIWAPKWSQTNNLDGYREHLCLWHAYLGIKFPTVFRTRSECRKFIEEHYGYIRQRPDLRSEPHGWRVPTAVKVIISELRTPR